MAASPSRRAAYEILLRVERDGAFVDELLHAERMNELDERDRALTSEIVLGVLDRQRHMLAEPDRTAGRHGMLHPIDRPPAV